MSNTCWVQTFDGELVDLNKAVHICVLARYGGGFALVANGPSTGNIDDYDSLQLYEGTKEECEAAMAQLPIDVRFDFTK